MAFVTLAAATSPNPPPAADAAAAAWARARAIGDIQFQPLNPPPLPPPSPPTPWLKAIIDWLAAHIGPLGNWLALHWRGVEIGAGVVLGLAIGWIAWRFWRMRVPQVAAKAPVEAWAPDRAAASALLADADALAAAGRFDAAVHLLLRRSFDDIAARRPEWLTPASTAREIAMLRSLPGPARVAFAAITREVERSRYALDRLGADDWARARAAYAGFAVPA